MNNYKCVGVFGVQHLRRAKSKELNENKLYAPRCVRITKYKDVRTGKVYECEQ